MNALLKRAHNLVPFHSDTQPGGSYGSHWSDSVTAGCYQYQHAMILDRPRGPRDPRKSWLYNTIPDSSWSTMDLEWTYPSEQGFLNQRENRRAYIFKTEQDLMLFRLRWEHQTLD